MHRAACVWLAQSASSGLQGVQRPPEDGLRCQPKDGSCIGRLLLWRGARDNRREARCHTWGHEWTSCRWAKAGHRGEERREEQRTARHISRGKQRKRAVHRVWSFHVTVGTAVLIRLRMSNPDDYSRFGLPIFEVVNWELDSTSTYILKPVFKAPFLQPTATMGHRVCAS